MIFSHLRWIRTPSQFSHRIWKNYEDHLFQHWGQPPPLPPPLAGATANEPHIDNKEKGKMNEEELLLAIGYLLLKRRIRRRKQLQAKNIRRMWVREIFKELERKGIFSPKPIVFCSCL